MNYSYAESLSHESSLGSDRDPSVIGVLTRVQSRTGDETHLGSTQTHWTPSVKEPSEAIWSLSEQNLKNKQISIDLTLWHINRRYLCKWLPIIKCAYICILIKSRNLVFGWSWKQNVHFSLHRGKQFTEQIVGMSLIHHLIKIIPCVFLFIYYIYI